MSNESAGTSKATQPLLELRDILSQARTADDAERIHAALIDVVDGILTHVEKQARHIADLQSDVSHKQGIVSRIGGGDYSGPVVMPTGVSANDDLDL